MRLRAETVLFGRGLFQASEGFADQREDVRFAFGRVLLWRKPLLAVPGHDAFGGQPIGPLADYIAMLALGQGQYYDDCQPVPTITNFMAPKCESPMKPAGLTDIDMTYLRGLYHMSPGGSYMLERAHIAFAMKKELGGY